MKRVSAVLSVVLMCTRTSAQENANTLFVKAVEKCWGNELDSAVFYLQMSFEKGYQHPSEVLSQKAFRPLRNDADRRWKLNRMLRQHAVESEVTIVDEREKGDRLTINGSILDSEGNPVRDAIFYLYQTDNQGLYAPENLRPGFGSNNPRLFGYCRTDTNGQFTAHTIRPGSYIGTRSLRHVHFEITAPAGCDAVSEFILDKDPVPTENQVRDAHKRKFPILPAYHDGRGKLVVDFVWTCK